MRFFKDRPTWMAAKRRIFFWMSSFIPLCILMTGLFGLWEAKRAGIVGLIFCLPMIGIALFCPSSSSLKQSSPEKENLILIFSVLGGFPFAFLGLVTFCCLGLPVLVLGFGPIGWSFSWRSIFTGLGLMVAGTAMCFASWILIKVLSKLLTKVFRVQALGS